MKNILIIGAGRSSTSLIDYVLKVAADKQWFVTVADAEPKLAESKINGHPNGRAVWLDVNKSNDRKDLIRRTDVVVSLLPPHLHLEVAHDCIHLHKHLITASYVSSRLYQLAGKVEEKSLIFMGEMGLDPGIDHMSAMAKIDQIHDKGGVITSFRSYTGGLVAPQSDDNPWHYKFSWNPMNVILAGQGTAQYLKNGKQKYIPYHRLFERYKLVNVEGVGAFEGYPNRDSLLYRKKYGLGDVPTLVRGTLRFPGFCRAWNALIKLGLTDNSFPILESYGMTFQQFIEAFLTEGYGTITERVAMAVGEHPDSEVIDMLKWLGLFSKRKIVVKQGSPAMILKQLLVDKWKMKTEDKDMILMQHEFMYKLNKENYKLTSTLHMEGENVKHTAMSKLVGLPLGIFVKLVMTGEIKTSGIQIPVTREVYEPVLEELKMYDVTFTEKEILLS
jgi:saccharopine dehydrogenase (NADP+, L-glutamate forming)